MADSIADCIADDLIGMAYQLGNWPTIARRLVSPGDWVTADLYQACLIFHPSRTERSSGYGPFMKLKAKSLPKTNQYSITFTMTHALRLREETLRVGILKQPGVSIFIERIIQLSYVRRGQGSCIPRVFEKLWTTPGVRCMMLHHNPCTST